MTPILAVGTALPATVRAVLPEGGSGNISLFVVRARNTGKLAVDKLGLLLVPEGETVLLEHEIQTSPAHGVPRRASTEEGNRVRCSNVALAPGQEVQVSLYLRSASNPVVRPYWSSQDTVFRQGHLAQALDFDRHLTQMARNAIGAIVAPTLTASLFLIIVGTLPAPDVLPVPQQGAGIAGTAAVIGTLVQWCFLLRMVPCATALARDLRAGAHRSGAPRQSIIDLRAETVAGFEDVERRRGGPDRRQT